MRRDRILLRSGYIASLAVAVAAYLIGLGVVASATILLSLIFLTRVSIYLSFERFLAFKAFYDFRAEKIRHECIACGASCHLKVNLGKDDVERILNYAKEKSLSETVIEKSGSRFWLKRQRDGACIFLTYEGQKPRCSIYSIRPTACRLYPLIPAGNRLKVDPLCPGLSRAQGHTFKQHLATQEIGAYVRKVMGKV
jgi:Fe-S-cluster containining protein